MACCCWVVLTVVAGGVESSGGRDLRESDAAMGKASAEYDTAVAKLEHFRQQKAQAEAARDVSVAETEARVSGVDLGGMRSGLEGQLSALQQQMDKLAYHGGSLQPALLETETLG